MELRYAVPSLSQWTASPQTMNPNKLLLHKKTYGYHTSEFIFLFNLEYLLETRKLDIGHRGRRPDRYIHNRTHVEIKVKEEDTGVVRFTRGIRKTGMERE